MFLLKRLVPASQQPLSRPLLQIGKRPIHALIGKDIIQSRWLPPTVSSIRTRKLSSLPADTKMVALAPRTFASSGFEAIDTPQDIEEENLLFYDPRMFYPVRLGEVFQGRYQVVAKLG